MRRHSKLLAAAGVLVAAAAATLVGRRSADAWALRPLLQGTAGVSALVFLVLYAAPLAVADRRRAWWLLGLSHGVHAAAIAWFVRLGGPVSRVAIVVGGIGYVLLAAAVLTPSRTAAEPGVQRVARHYLWGVFVLIYGSHLAEHVAPHRVLAIAALLAAPLARRWNQPGDPR